MDRPTDAGFSAYLSRQGTAVVLQAREFRRVGGSGNPLVRASQVVRRTLLDRVQAIFPAREGGLLMGLALGDTSHLEVKVVERQLDGRIGHSERVHEGHREVDEVEGVVGQGTRCVRVESGPFQGRVPRDDVAAVLALLVRDDRFSRRVFYVNSGEDPIERALERVLAS